MAAGSLLPGEAPGRPQITTRIRGWKGDCLQITENRMSIFQNRCERRHRLTRRPNIILLMEYSPGRILRSVAWEVEFTDEFSRWWGSLTENQQDDVAYSVGLLTELGPALGFPHSSKIMGSSHSGMRELRTQSQNRKQSIHHACSKLS
jgi:hypothetical protein